MVMSITLILAACGGGGGGGGGDGDPVPHTVGGSISGLAANGLVLANGGDTLSVSAGATSFTLPTALASGSSFNVIVQTQPVGQTCVVSGGSGTVGTSNVTS